MSAQRCRGWPELGGRVHVPCPHFIGARMRSLPWSVALLVLVGCGGGKAAPAEGTAAGDCSDAGDNDAGGAWCDQTTLTAPMTEPGEPAPSHQPHCSRPPKIAPVTYSLR